MGRGSRDGRVEGIDTIPAPSGELCNRTKPPNPSLHASKPRTCLSRVRAHFSKDGGKAGVWVEQLSCRSTIPLPKPILKTFSLSNSSGGFVAEIENASVAAYIIQQVGWIRDKDRASGGP
jgi:hypothetical protein